MDDKNFIKYSVLEKEVNDIRHIKYQITMSILIENRESATEYNLRRLLDNQYSKLYLDYAPNGHLLPSIITIFAYDSKELYEQKSGLWKAMITGVDNERVFKMATLDEEVFK